MFACLQSSRVASRSLIERSRGSPPWMLLVLQLARTCLITSVYTTVIGTVGLYYLKIVDKRLFTLWKHPPL